MNCKPNQRAMFTRAFGCPDNTKYLGAVFVVRHIHDVEHPALGPMWVVDPDYKLKTSFQFGGVNQVAGAPINYVVDACLTPLPDDDLEAEKIIEKELEKIAS